MSRWKSTLRQLHGGDRGEGHGAAEALALLDERQLSEGVPALELAEGQLVPAVPDGDAHPAVRDDEQALGEHVLHEQRRPAG
jgi:hypothetical protein